MSTPVKAPQPASSSDSTAAPAKAQELTAEMAGGCELAELSHELQSTQR